MTNREKYINNASDEEIANALCGIGLMYRYSPDTQIRIKEWLSQEVEDAERISCNVCKYAISNGYHSSFMHHHICMNPKSARYNKGVDVVNDGCDKGEVKEAEEDIVNIPNIGKMPKTDKTKTPSSWDDIRPLIETDENIAMLIKEIIALQERVKELEKYSLIGRNLILTELKTPEINAVPLNGYSSIETKTADEMFKELGYKKEFSDKNGCNYYHKEINRSGVKSEHIIHVLSNESSTLYGKYERLDDKEFAANISVAEDKAIHKKIEELKNG